MKLNLILFVVIAAGAWALTVFMDRQAPAIIEQPELASETLSQDEVPAFEFTATDGKTYSIRDFKGKIVLLNFWASWCPPCVKEFPQLLELAEKNNDTLVLIALSSDLGREDMDRFLSAAPMRGDNVFIALDDDQQITQKIFQTYKLPETILIDRLQVMREKIAGADWNAAALQKRIDALQQ